MFLKRAFKFGWVNLKYPQSSSLLACQMNKSHWSMRFSTGPISVSDISTYTAMQIKKYKIDMMKKYKIQTENNETV